MQADDEKLADGITVGEPNELGLVAKMRPILPTIATGDPLRFALHFETKDGPVMNAGFAPVPVKPEGGEDKAMLAMQMLDRAATMKSMEIAIRPPGGKWEVKKLADKDLPARKTMLYSDATYLLELGEGGVRSLNQNGSEQMATAWDKPWDAMLAPGDYQIAVRGRLYLETREQVIRRRGEPDKKIEAKKQDVAFQSKPITIKVERTDMTFMKLAELEEKAVEALKKEVADNGEDLTVQGIDSLAISDGEGNRLIRVRANLPPPKPGEPIIGGGRGYWQYEVAMSPAGKVVAFNRMRKGFCIARGTMVATPDGERAVETLRPGELVWAWDEKESRRVAAPLLAVHVSDTDRTLMVNDLLRLTSDHPVATSGKQGAIKWKPAGLLTAGDLLYLGDGMLSPVRDVTPLKKPTTVYDLSVAGPHNFFAGGVLVHNKSVIWTPKAFVPWYSLWNRPPKPK